MKKGLFVVSGTLVLVIWHVLNPAMALGQGNTWVGTSLSQMVEKARWRFGELRINAAFELTNAGYDSDIFYGYFGPAVPDLSFTGSLPAQVLLNLGKNIVLDLTDTPQYVYYQETIQERTWNNTFEGRLHYASDRFYIQAGGGLSNVRQRLSPEVNLNVQQKQESLSGNLLWQASQAMSLALLVERARLEYGNAEFDGTQISETLNRRQGFYDLIAYIQPNSKVRLFIDGQFGRYAFTEAASSFKDTRSYSLYGGIMFVPVEKEEIVARPIEPPQGSISLGYKRFNIVDPLLSDGSALVGSMDVSAGLFRRTSGRVFFSRDFTFSAFSSGTFYLSTVYGAGLSRLLSRHARCSYDLSFTRSTYPEAGTVGTPSGLNSRYTTHNFNISVQLARDLEIHLLGIFGRRILDAQGLVTNRNFIGISMIYGSVPGTIVAPGRIVPR